MFSGIGNAYSDEILHTAGLSPVKWTSRLSGEEISSLYVAIRDTLLEWTEKLKDECGDERFPEKVTAFKEGMAAHGRCGKPCPVCDTAIQEIVYAANETNYCPVVRQVARFWRIACCRGCSRMTGQRRSKTWRNWVALWVVLREASYRRQQLLTNKLHCRRR